MVPQDLMKDLPKIGEVWWLSDVIVLVVGFKSEGVYEGVVGAVLFDLDDVFDPGEEMEIAIHHATIHDSELTEQNRRIV